MTNPRTREVISKEEILQRFSYDQRAGILTRLSNGKPAGFPTKKGYLRITIDSIPYFVHRIIWLLETGAWPTAFIDHANGLNVLLIYPMYPCRRTQRIERKFAMLPASSGSLTF